MSVKWLRKVKTGKFSVGEDTVYEIPLNKDTFLEFMGGYTC